MDATSYEHEPVLVGPILSGLDPRPGDIVVDATVGLGGHAAALIPRILPGGRYIGLDLDERMLAAARLGLAAFSDVIHLEKSNYAEFGAVLDRLGIGLVRLILADVGVNSAQLDDPTRGFLFDQEAPLDMRFDPSQKLTATDLVNSLSERELADVIFEYGQDTLSRRIAKRICQVRHDARITTTGALARAVESVHSAMGDAPGKRHPATRVFQALRIAVNRELENLEKLVAVAPNRLADGGRIAVISFHSLEDGIVKRAFRGPREGGVLREITKRPIVADDAERRANPRSRSAKLRIAERIARQ